MDGRAASQTITDKIPYFLEKGYSLFVLSAITGEKDTRFDHAQLVAWGPSAFRFDFRHWLALRLGRNIIYKFLTALVSGLLLPFIFIEKIFLGLSSQWSWSLPAIVRGFWWLKKKKIDVIYTTGGAWSAHFAGWILKRLSGCKLMVEIHDPLVVRVAKNEITLRKDSSRDAKFQRWLEKVICRDADCVWWFTSGALSYAQARNPSLGSKGFFLLPGVAQPSERVVYERTDTFNIGHFGSLAESRSLEPILNVLPVFFQRYPEAKDVFKIHIYGSNLDRKSKKICQDLKLESSVVIHGRLEYDMATKLTGRQQIVRKMQTSDFLLLLHGDYEGCSEYIPSKLYEYWWSDRPVIACTYINPQLDQLINKINGPDFSALLSHVDNQCEIFNSLEFSWFAWQGNKQFKRQAEPLDVAQAAQQIIEKIETK